MKNIKLVYLSLMLIALPMFVSAQDELKKGFGMLETGKFADAAVFFKEFLVNKDSTNKTALLCYGRGIGLSGNVPEAKRVFNKLLERFPGDFEVGLNAAEAFMWASEYPQAEAYYKSLLAVKSDDFAANLGYANAQANLFNYTTALEFLAKALLIQPGNESAKVSQKYAWLGYADQLSKAQKYEESIKQLDNIFINFPDDIDALFAKAQVFTMLEKYTEAVAINEHIRDITKGRTETYLNLSYLAFLRKKKTEALELADKAVESTATQKEKYLKARLGRVSALAWNDNFKLAFAELVELDSIFNKPPEVALKRASLLTADKEFKKSVALFKEVLKTVPSSFDGNLGCADALLAQELDMESKEYVNKTLSYYPNQKDAMAFLDRIAMRHAPLVSTHNYISSDKGGNSSKNYSINFNFDLKPKLRMSVGYKSRFANFQDANANTEYYWSGLRWRIHPLWLMSGQVSTVTLNKANSEKEKRFLTEFTNEFKLTKLQSLEIKYQSDIQNFTAGLIDRNLKFHNIIATYNLNTPFKVGLYSQYFYTFQSDKNQRSLLFASLYYTLIVDPIIKFGFNFNTISFKNQVPEVYFSPNKFKGYELFAALENLDLPKPKFLYQISVAGGLQKIEEQDNQGTYRVQLAAGIRPRKNFDALIYTMNSNSSTSSVVGYTYFESGFKAKWIIPVKKK